MQRFHDANVWLGAAASLGATPGMSASTLQAAVSSLAAQGHERPCAFRSVCRRSRLQEPIRRSPIPLQSATQRMPPAYVHVCAEKPGADQYVRHPMSAAQTIAVVRTLSPKEEVSPTSTIQFPWRLAELDGRLLLGILFD